MKELTHLSLFSGIGGADLAAEWAGFQTVAFVEKDPFCQKVLAKHWPNVPIHGDIKEFSGKSFRGVTLLTGGFPCQPFSQAGKRAGRKDDRYLWPEMLRVIKQSKPTWVVGENVAGLLGMEELESILLSLEGANYELWPIILPACAAGAPHQRNRLFILAHSLEGGRRSRGFAEHDLIRERTNGSEEQNHGKEIRRSSKSFNRDSVSNATDSTHDAEDDRVFIADTLSAGRKEFNAPAVAAEPRLGCRRAYENFWQPDWSRQWTDVASELCRVDDGISRGMDKSKRLRALGNAIVPQQIYPILKAIADIER